MRIQFRLTAILALLPWGFGEAQDLDLQSGTKVHFATKAETAKQLGEADGFVKAMGPFDRAARLKVAREVTEKEYLEFVAAQALEWSAAEKKTLTDRVAKLSEQIAPFKLSLPPTISLLRTSGKEEGGAAYCRGALIVLPPDLFGHPGLESTLAHELFHVYSSHNLKLRPALYAVVGFAPCSPVKFPETLSDRRITNPDAYGMEYFITIKVGATKSPAIPILYSRVEEYDPKAGNEFFDFLEVRLLLLEKDGDAMKAAVDEKGQPRLLKIDEAPDYMEQIGRNTGYIIHPEEVLADNFVLMITGKQKLKSPQIVEGMKKVISEAAAR